MKTIVKSFCARLCSGTCGIRVTLEGQRITNIQGDSDCPFNRGAICPKVRALPELLYHPDRLTLPLKRIGRKGADQWQPISTDEALETIAGKLNGYAENCGPESILLFAGAYRGLERDFIQRFARVLGTPNTVSVDNNCHVPRTMAARYTFGAMPFPDFEHPPQCLMIWGRNSLQTGGDGSPAQFRPAFDGRTQLIVIDPRKISLAARADIWLKPRPGSDGLLALGMLNVIVNEKLYDAEFVDQWTVGFKHLQAFLAAYPPAMVAEKTWMPSSRIERAARMFAQADCAAIQWGNALDQTSNAFQTCRAAAILTAITGNLDVPGGAVFPDGVPLLRGADFSLTQGVEAPRKAPVGSCFKLAARANLVPSQEASQAILAQAPYPLKAGLIFGSNPLLTYAGARQTHAAFQKLDFLVVADLFSEALQELGLDPLPVYCEPKLTPFGSPELATEYPLVLTSSKNPFFYHASHRNIASLRRLSPAPLADMHPQTAAGLGLKAGESVCIETPAGRINQTLRLNANLDPRVVIAAFGWWFPEKGPSELYEWQKANLNMLTDASPPYDPAMGSANLRGILCRVFRAD